MRNGAYREVLKAGFFVAAAIVLGAWTATFFYNAGMALAEVTKEKTTNALVNELGEICRGLEFPRYFTGSLIAMGGLLIVPFLKAVNWRRGERHWLRPEGGWAASTAGFFLMAAVFGIVAAGLRKTSGWAALEPATPMLGSFVWGSFLVVIEEWLFRGIILGILSRATSGRRAIAISVALFAVVHLLVPPPGFNVPDPDASGVGFEMLALLTTRLIHPLVWITEIFPLLAMGWILAEARCRTGAVWLPVALHGGWLLANDWLLASARPTGKMTWLTGTSLISGLVPLIGLLLSGWLLLRLSRRKTDEVTADV